MNRLLVLLKFYKLFFYASLVATLLISLVNLNYVAAVITKLFLTGFAWYFITETTHKRKLTFYKNIGISPFMLFSFVYILDSMLTIFCIFLITELKLNLAL